MVLLADCFKKNFAKKLNNSCGLPWTYHFKDELVAAGRLNSKSCNNEDTLNVFKQQSDLKVELITGKNSPCKGLFTKCQNM